MGDLNPPLTQASMLTKVDIMKILEKIGKISEKPTFSSSTTISVG